MRKLILFLGVLLLTLGLVVGTVGATLHVVKDTDNTYILYEDEAGVDILKIDDDDGVTIANYTTGNTYTTMTVTSTLDASSLTAGSVVTAGGIACAKQLFIGDDLDMSVGTTGVYDITLRDTVNDALSIVGGSTDMMVFDTDTDAILIVPPLTVTGAIINDSTTDTSSGTTGAIQTDGGIGIAKNLWVAVNTRLVGTVTCDDVVSIDDTTEATGGTDGSLHTDGGVGIAKKLYVVGAVDFASTLQLDGALTVSADGAGVDVKIYGNTASYYLLFDADGDTNGAFYVGADTKGVLMTMYGDTTGCGVFWDPSGDTNGTLSVGATGGSKGVDFLAYGATNGHYMHWDRSGDDLLLAGAATLFVTAGTVDTSLTSASIKTAGGIACTKQLWLGDDIDMSTNGTGVYDITLKTNMADALSITDGTDIIVFETTTGTPVVTITPITTITGALTLNGGLIVADDQTVAFGTGSDITMDWDNTRAALVTDPAGYYVSPEGMSDRFRLTWVAGERGKPSINADILDSTEATRMIADPHFEILGGGASSDDVTHYAEGGIDLETDGTDGNGVVLLPHLDASQTAWTQVTWGTDKEVRWECTIKTGAAITTSIIWAGLKLTNTATTITDADQIFFRYEDDVNTGKWEAVSSIADSDDEHDSGVTVAVNTVYHLVIEIASNRTAKMYINGTLVETSAALTDAIDLIPYIGIEEDGASSAMTLYIRGQAISRAY